MYSAVFNAYILMVDGVIIPRYNHGYLGLAVASPSSTSPPTHQNGAPPI